jgi:isopropylmalate/homocitrate/citramalate synthase
LAEPDAIKAISEICRVATKYLFLLIDDKVERNVEHITRAKAEGVEIFKDVENLHMTVKPFSWWKEQINRHGFELQDLIQVHPEDEIKLAVFK